MRVIICFLALLIISKFASCQMCIGLDTLSLKDFYSKDIIILGSKSDLFLRMGNPNKINESYIVCFHEINDYDSILFMPKRINFTSYTYDNIGLQYIDINDEVMLRMISFEKGSNLTIVHPKLTFNSKLKLEEFLKRFPNFDISEELALNYLKTKNKRKKVHVVRFCTGYSNCNGFVTEVIFDPHKYLRIIYFNHINTQQIR